MKKIIRPLIFVTLISILTSCSEYNSISITKRHYRSGFNLEHSFKRQPDFQQEKEVRFFVNHVLKNETEQVVKEEQISIEQSSETAKLQGEAIIAKQNINTKAKQAVLNLTPLSSKNINKASVYTEDIFSINRNTASVSERGDSIIWTLISIFLVLWLISLLTGGWGLGGLIYIFLVVALVLLLLRLLHAI